MAAAADGGGNEAVARLGRGAGLDALRVAVNIAAGAPVGDEKVRRVQLARLFGHVGGGHGVALGIADLHELVVLHRLARDEVEIPCGRIVLGIVQTRGIGKVCVLAAKLCRALIHARNERLDRAADVLAENVARLVCRDDEHAVEQLLDRHRFAGDDVSGAAVTCKTIERRLRCGDGVVEREPALVDGLEYEQRGHDLRERSGVVLLVGVFFVKDLARVRFDEKTRARVQIKGFVSVGACQRKEGEQEKKG